MERILLLSDTHGSLDSINELVERTRADSVIHAGDFGFYDEGSLERLSDRELKLLVVHSPFKKQLSGTPKREELVKIVHENALLGNFQEYRSGKKRFSVPVYAVWGNHEDVSVIKKVFNGDPVENLFLLDENHLFEMSDFLLAGIGGNFLTGRKLFGPPLSGRGGKVWSTLHQYGALYQKLQENQKPLIFVSHVSPGKEPLLSRLLTHFKPHFWISGHMGAPYTCVWNQLTIREEKDALEWMEQEVEKGNRELSIEAQLAGDLMHTSLKDDLNLRLPWNINLPDAHEGHAVLVVDQGRFSLETYSKGLLFQK